MCLILKLILSRHLQQRTRMVTDVWAWRRRSGANQRPGPLVDECRSFILYSHLHFVSNTVYSIIFGLWKSSSWTASRKKKTARDRDTSAHCCLSWQGNSIVLWLLHFQIQKNTCYSGLGLPVLWANAVGPLPPEITGYWKIIGRYIQLFSARC